MLLVALVGGVVLALVAAVGGDDEEAGGPRETTTSTAPVSAEGEELLARLERGRALQLHIRFDPDPAQVATDGSQLSMELWRDGDLVRQELVLDAPGVRTQIAAFQRPDGTFICQRASEAEWQCEATRSTATENGDAAGIIESAASNLSGADVTTSEQTVGGFEARCYAIDGGADTSEMCVTEEGVPVRLGVEGQQLTASSVERTVDRSAFELPADVDA